MKTISKLEWISGLLFLVLGLGCFFFPLRYADAFFYVCAGLASLSCLMFVWRAIRAKRGQYWLFALLSGLMAGFLWFHRLYSQQLIGVVFAFYLLFNAVVELVQTILDFRDRVHGRIEPLLMTLAYFSLFIACTAMYRRDIRWIMYYFGAYLLLQAFQSFAELYVIRHPHTSRTYTFNHWVTLPVYFVCLLPYFILSHMDRRLIHHENVVYNERKNEQSVNLRVFIHSGLQGDHRVGHMTFSYQGIMFSYGNYDTASEKLFRTIGPGILFTAPADIYVNNCCIYEGSTLFEFGLHLSDAQRIQLETELQDILDNTQRWYCPIEKAKEGWRDFAKYEKDYASRLSFRTGAKFRTFDSGPWKTYWVMGDNCALFAEDILSRLGCQIAHKNGIVTPGEYFEFFQEAYADPKSNVIYRSWHSAKVPSTLYPTLA